MKDLYQILGVKKGASDADIKSAYRKLAKKLHPDANPGDEKIAERFKEVSAAYAILGDKKQRKRYDAGEIDASGQERQPFGGGAGAQSGSARARAGAEAYRRFEEAFAGAGSDPRGGADDIFSDLFGFSKGGFGAGGKQKAAKTKGRDVPYTLNISFLDAARGASKRVTLSTGKTLDIRIPSGVKDGQQIRLAGQGAPGPGGAPAGDALVRVTVERHPWFIREGDDIHIELPITVDEAVLGGKITVPTLDGQVTMSLPRGVSSGKKLRLSGKGIWRDKKRPGDQYVTLKVVLPAVRDRELEDAMTKWRESHKYSPRAKFGVD